MASLAYANYLCSFNFTTGFPSEKLNVVVPYRQGTVPHLSAFVYAGSYNHEDLSPCSSLPSLHHRSTSISHPSQKAFSSSQD